MRARRMAIGDNYYNGSQYCWPPAVCSNQIDGISSPCWPNCNTDLVVQGNVGIGTSNPNEMFHVQHYGDSTTMAAGKFEVGVPGYTGTSLIASNTLSPATTFNLFSAISDSDGDAGGPNTEFVIRGDGNVGIGTTNPVEKLDVDGLIKIKFYGSVPSDSDNGPEAYRVTDGGPPCDSSHRGSIAVMRPSGAGPQDALCFCGDIAGTYMWSCFNL